MQVFCDTEFASGTQYTAQQLVAEVRPYADTAAGTGIGLHLVEGARPVEDNGPKGPLRNVLFCGGEPLLQLDEELVAAFKADDPRWFLAVETNGAHEAPPGLDWVACSPKVAEHAIKLKFAHELKYVRGYGQGIPRPKLTAQHYLISPLFDATNVPEKTLQWCVQLVLDNPGWRLSVQHHKLTFGGMR